MSNQGETDLHNIINLINTPTTIVDQNQITDLLNRVLKQNINLVYDGYTFCQLSGEIIGNKKKIELKLPNDQTVIVLQDKLKELIKTHCFINERFDPFYSTINGISFLLESQQNQVFTDPINLEITDDILKLVFENDFDKIKKETKNFYEESYKYMEEFAGEYPLKCYKTQKEILIINDGFNIQSKWFSLEGALKMLEEEKDKLFSHQIEFLNNYKKILKI